VPQHFGEEYQCEFIDNDASLFSTAIIEAAFTRKVQPLW
jgi:hypothetical protein